MWHLSTLISPSWGAWAVFFSVLLTQFGLPFPAAPMLIVAGTMAAVGDASLSHMLAAAVCAVLLADTVWFIAGRRHGRKVLNSIVRFSLSLDTTVRVARQSFEKFGAPLLAVSKFVPGLGLVSSPLMGTTTVDIRIFWLWDFVGASLWASFYLIGGAALESEILNVMTFIRDNGWTAFDVLATMTVLLLSYRWIRRLQFRRWLNQVRISPEQLHAMLHSDTPPVVFDARPESIRRKEAVRIPGAVRLDLCSPDKLDVRADGRPIVIYCVCPNEATAKRIISQLRRKSIYHAQALQGGLDAWEKSGFPVEPIPAFDNCTADYFARSVAVNLPANGVGEAIMEAMEAGDGRGDADSELAGCRAPAP